MCSLLSAKLYLLSLPAFWQAMFRIQRWAEVLVENFNAFG